MKTWLRDCRDFVLRNFGAKLWNSFQVRVILVLLDGEVVGTSRICYKKRNFQRYCTMELKRYKQTKRFFVETDFNHISPFHILAFVLIHSFIYTSVHSFIHSNMTSYYILGFPKCHGQICIPHQIYVYTFLYPLPSHKSSHS